MRTEDNQKIFWTEKVEPYLIKGSKYGEKLKEREETFFKEERKRKCAQKKMKLVRGVVEKLRWIGWIRAIVVTGSVATGWAKKDDDIDLMVICHNNRLWICRIIVVFWLMMFGYKLRNFGREKSQKDRLCFNLWLEERSMEISRSRQNILTALDLAWSRPVLEREGAMEMFYQKNRWIKKYLKFEIGKCKRTNKGDKNLIMDLVNLVLFRFQYWYMKGKVGKELISIDKAYFHPRGKLSFGRI